MDNTSIPWWMRIRTHVLLFGLAMSIFPLFILSNLSFNTVKQYMLNSIWEQNFEGVSVLADEVQEVFKNIENNLSYISVANGDALLGDDENKRQLVFKTLLDQEPFVEEIRVADKNLTVLDKIPWGNTAESDLFIPSHQSIFLSKVIFAETGDPKMYVTTAIPDPNTGERIGYFQVKIDLNSIIDNFTGHRLSKEGNLYFIDKSGNLIGHTEYSRVLDREDFRGNPAVQNFLEGNEYSQGTEYKNSEGTNVIGWFAKVGNPDWGVFIEQTTREAYQPIYSFTLKLLIIAILIMIIGSLLSIIFGLKLVQPLENLEGQVKKIISTGDIQEEIPIESWDEIGRLVQSFNQLLFLLDETNENLKNEKELLRIVVDGIGAGMVLLDEERNIVWWNSIFARWFGDKLTDLPWKLSLEKDRVFTVNVNGEHRHMRQILYELTPDKSNNAAYLLLLEDVTQQTEMEARMIESDKMATVGLLASGVAHEINNPLAIVAAHSEDLLDRLKEEDQSLEQDEIKAGLNIVLEQVIRCKQIISRLLGLARKSHDNDYVDIGQSSAQVLELLKHRAKQKNIKIVSQIDAGLFVLGNESEWQQVVLNIVTNALDASNAGGTLEVAAGRDDNNNEEIHFSVHDYGQGIPEKYLKKLFVPFFTTKPVGQGTGLGLFISYSIVQKMQGKLFIDSTEGKGTIVDITLPSYKVGA
ncbi:ATP-binding protein [Dehalobacterium formicoaceticum]|uniref:histidine kinase n=1 Tax=Dehalobacterium formicoaceticum TaxID=51515 RepID=A0ABT1Y5B1_9FIRM|nr:ATP-binding protein [Dehalobacterium formicoaceticum]